MLRLCIVEMILKYQRVMDLKWVTNSRQNQSGITWCVCMYVCMVSTTSVAAVTWYLSKRGKMSVLQVPLLAPSTSSTEASVVRRMRYLERKSPSEHVIH